MSFADSPDTRPPPHFTADEEREISRLIARGMNAVVARQRVTEDRYRRRPNLPKTAKAV